MIEDFNTKSNGRDNVIRHRLKDEGYVVNGALLCEAHSITHIQAVQYNSARQEAL